MNMDFVNLTPENLANEHLCCIIRSKKPHQGVENGNGFRIGWRRAMYSEN